MDGKVVKAHVLNRGGKNEEAKDGNEGYGV